MEKILLPSKIEFKEGDLPYVGEMVVAPCQQGYGTTLGNALRRVLLSSLPGAAVESFKINGVSHEFSAIEGVQEDVIEIILNLKQLAVKSHSEEPVTLTLSKKGVGDVTAADFEKNADIEVINSDLKICTITDKNFSLEMEITVGRGRGYVAVAEKETRSTDLGTIVIDSLYTPIRDVGYKVEMTRVGDVTDYEKLALRIETDGSITPKEAVDQATRLLMDHFVLIMDATGGGAKETEPEKAEIEEAVSEEEDKVENDEPNDDK